MGRQDRIKTELLNRIKTNGGRWANLEIEEADETITIMKTFKDKDIYKLVLRTTPNDEVLIEGTVEEVSSYISNRYPVEEKKEVEDPFVEENRHFTIEGWAFGDEDLKISRSSRYKEIKDKGLVTIESTSNHYARNTFKGTYNPLASPEDILIVCDRGNTCFGGTVTLLEGNRFNATVYTD